MELNKSLFIEKRSGATHLSLDGKWQFTYFERPADDILSISYKLTATLPQSAGWCLFESGELPHPYYGTNSEKYKFITDRVFYFNRRFDVSKDMQGSSYAYLCFDGCAYYTRVWLNGVLLGQHEGMFGGPVVEISKLLKYGETNEITVETTACNYGCAGDIDESGKYGMKTWSSGKSAIVPWNLVNDSATTNGHFNVIGIWRSVRIEFLPEYHITNPYLYTESVYCENGAENAKVRLEIPICTPFTEEPQGLSSRMSVHDHMPRYMYSAGLKKTFNGDVLEIETKITDAENGRTVYCCTEQRKPFSLKPMYDGEKPNDHLYYCKTIELENIKLWYPNGHGAQPLYNVEIKLSANGRKCDKYSFVTAFRTVEVKEGPNEKLYRRWEKFSFSVNGKKIFIKGMNFAPTDQMLKESPDEIKWVLELAKNEGIGLIRIWNGGGTPESDLFYDLCDRNGFLVWQDELVANAITPKWDVEVMRSQMFYFLCRLRNHPSLAVLCGGNEFNPYAAENAASMYAMWDETQTLAPDRIFYRTTPNGGSAHIYNDMEPTWYRLLYKNIAFIGESGIHNFPAYKTLKQVISKKEAETALSNIFSDRFEAEFPQLRNHFNEFQPERVPRMLARASHICDIKSISLENLTEATQMSAYEYYLIMIESMLENYPMSTGIMPWVFKRPWPTAAIQIVDGFGNPEAQYYAIKRAYQGCHPFAALETVAFKSCEIIKLPIKVFCDHEIPNPCTVTTEIYDDELNRIFEKHEKFNEIPQYCSDVAEYEFELPKKLCDAYFFIRVKLVDKNGILGESFYYPKVLSCFDNKEVFENERSKPCGNMFFDNGPFLKNQVSSCKHGKLCCESGRKKFDGRRCSFSVVVSNAGDIPIFPVKIDTEDEKVRCMCSDNYFMLDIGETKTVDVVLDGKFNDGGKITVSGWNIDTVIL